MSTGSSAAAGQGRSTSATSRPASRTRRRSAPGATPLRASCWATCPRRPPSFPSTPVSRLDRYALFAQDEWRATSDLTLSYGLRWDYQPPYREADDQISTFLPDIPNPGAGGLPGALAFASTDPRPLRSIVSRTTGTADSARASGLGYSLNAEDQSCAPPGDSTTTGQATRTRSPPSAIRPARRFRRPNNFTPVFNWNTQPFPQSFSRPPAPQSLLRQRPGRDLHHARRRTPSPGAELHGRRGARTRARIDARPELHRKPFLAPRRFRRTIHEINFVPIEYLSLGNLSVPADQFRRRRGRRIPRAVPWLRQSARRQHRRAVAEADSRNTRRSRRTRRA